MVASIGRFLVYSAFLVSNAGFPRVESERGRRLSPRCLLPVRTIASALGGEVYPTALILLRHWFLVCVSSHLSAGILGSILV